MIDKPEQVRPEAAATLEAAAHICLHAVVRVPEDVA